MPSLFDQQVAIEEMMLAEAHSRQAKDEKQAEDRKEYGAARASRVFVNALMKQVAEPIAGFINSVKERKNGKQVVAAKLLLDTDIEPQVIAWLTCKAIMNTFGMVKASSYGVKRVTLSRMIGDLVHDEWRVRVFNSSDQRKGILRKLMQDFDKRSYPRAWRKDTIKNYFDAEQLDWNGWTTKQKIIVGYSLLVLFRQVVPYISDSNNGSMMHLTPEFIDKLQTLMKNQVHMFTLFRPMVVKPKPWTTGNLYRGGYLLDKTRRYPLIKGLRKRDLTRLGNFNWNSVLPPINAIQETPWRVNPIMTEALDWAYNEYGGNIGKLVRNEEIPLPPMPENYDSDPAVKKAHLHKVFLIHSQNREDTSRRIAAIMTISMAKSFQKYDAIYFPHNLDSRGRAYPLPAFLTPQGADYAKALLEFSTGEPVETQAQLDWVMISGANAYGNDKVSLQERVEWVHENESMILSIAQDYKHDKRWMQASEPFQFLRFCFEWQTYRELGYGFQSHMVCPVDATCSGLQHYAAMLKDEVGGRSVNLVPHLSRQDIYGDVASQVIIKCVTDGSPVAKGWLQFGVDRKITKRQVMVVPYAGTFNSCLSYTKEAVYEKLKSGVKLPWNVDDEESTHARIVFLAKLIWSSIDDVVVKGKLGMKWLSKLASNWSKYANANPDLKEYDKRMSWVTPDGFEVVHYREDEKRTTIDTFLDGRVQLVVYDGTGKLSGNNMSLALAPNFVHSMDACHLRMTMVEALSKGITSFGMVHDSFGVHAKHMPNFIKHCVKPSFIKMYSEHDVLQELADRYASVIEVPAMVTKGELDLQGIQDSEFFFS